MRTIRIGATWGASVGAAIAVIMISLDQLGPFSVSVNGFVDRVIFRLCPFYVFGFSNAITSKTSWFMITIAGNAVLYGILFAVIAFGIALLRKCIMYRAS